MLRVILTAVSRILSSALLFGGGENARCIWVMFLATCHTPGISLNLRGDLRSLVFIFSFTYDLELVAHHLTVFF